MKSKFKLGQVVCDRSSLKKPANQRNYYVVIQEETDERHLVIQAINSNSLHASGTSINPSHPEVDLAVTELKASYLLYQEITILESVFKELIISDAIGYVGNDRFVTFTTVNDDLVGNIYYEIKGQNKTTLSGYLYCEFYRKEKFIKPPFQN
ncbi:MAG: hypothetical protein CFE24_07235 [Flavobacterium sp. BFFFF2]|nr:MAG: hypothetical protein CFE24_07235 [Flavobacterium sp. BFFFF2]